VVHQQVWIIRTRISRAFGYSNSGFQKDKEKKLTDIGFSVWFFFGMDLVFSDTGMID
jgi:hypothetical protein